MDIDVEGVPQLVSTGSLPGWNEVPGGCWIKEDAKEEPQPQLNADALPWDFDVKHDQLWAQQFAAIRALFPPAADSSQSRDIALDMLYPESS